MTTVSIVIPVRNEETNLGPCLASIAAQVDAHVVEVLVLDGGSTDRTAELARALPSARLVDNPAGIQSCAMNIAMREARGDVIVRVDARTRLAPDYVARCVHALQTTGAAIVGGAQRPVAPGGGVAAGIADAFASPLGAGPATFRNPDASGWVDTVYLGAWWRQLGIDAGGFDETLRTNEDADFAARMGACGGVWLDASIRCDYVVRGSLRAVARQFFAYGEGRGRRVRRDPRQIRPRQVAPLLLLCGLCSPWWRRTALLYVGIATARVAVSAPTDLRAAAGGVMALPAMHVPWALGFLRGVTRGAGHATERRGHVTATERRDHVTATERRDHVTATERRDAM